MNRRSPAASVLAGVALLLVAVVAGTFTVGMVRDTQDRKAATVCAGGETSDCLLRVEGRLSGPDDYEESAGDRYDFDPDGAGDGDDEVNQAFYTGQRSDRVWELRGRVDAAYYWNGEVVGIEDPDGGGLVRSERFSLRGPIAGLSGEVACAALGVLLVMYGGRRRKATAGWWSSRNADEPGTPGSGVPLAVLGGVGAVGSLVCLLLLWGSAWWFVAIVLGAVGAGCAWLWRAATPASILPGAGKRRRR